MGLFGDLDISSAADDPFAVDDGTYVAIVSSCAVAHSEKKNTNGLTFEYTILDDDSNPEKMHGRKVSEWLTIPETDASGQYQDADKGPKFASFIKRRLASLGVPEAEMNAVEPEDLVDITVVMTLKTKGDFQNIIKMAVKGVEGSDGWS